MSIKGLSFLAIGALCLIGVISFVIWAIGVSNQEIDLGIQCRANEKALMIEHDNMWKTIKQKFAIAESYKDGFAQVIQAASEGRKGGEMFKFIIEQMPNLSPDIYKEIMATVEGKRNILEVRNKKIVDICAEQERMVKKLPCRIVVGRRPLLVPHLITSTVSQEALETGVDNDISLK